MKNTKMFFALVFATFAFSGLMGMEEDGFFLGSGLEQEDTIDMLSLERVVSGGDDGFVLQKEVIAAKAVIEEKLQRSKRVKAVLDQTGDVNGDDILNFLVEKSLRYIGKHPNLFTNISNNVLKQGVLKTICVSILPTLTANAGEIIEKAPTYLQYVRSNLKECAWSLFKLGSVVVAGWVLWYSGVVSEGNISTVYNMFLDPVNVTCDGV